MDDIDVYTGLPNEVLKDWEHDFNVTFFTTPEGLRTFTWILEECGFFSLAEDEEDRVLNNLAKKLLYVANKMKPDAAARFVQSLTGGIDGG